MARDKFSYATISNIAFIEERYKEYQAAPESVDLSWRRFFEGVEFSDSIKKSFSSEEKEGGDAASRLIRAYRVYGHRYAKVNPLAQEPTSLPQELSLATFGFSDNDLSSPVSTHGLFDEEQQPLGAIIALLQETYCSTISFEYMSLERPDIEAWIQKRIEPCRSRPTLALEEKRMILDYLNKSEILESFLQTKYVGQKRFSLEGGETLVPMLAAFLDRGAKLGMQECVIGMAHRGRLNVLTNILNKSYSVMFHEFEASYIPGSFEGSGDVKYHRGFSSDIKTHTGEVVRVSVAANPSHLESVDPVVVGQAKALQMQVGADGEQAVVPLLIHGDAAVAGQGVVYETLQLFRIPGYSTGGTVHIVINNQVGFTASPEEGRSTRYCTDLARAFDAPVIHVNAEDPEACIFAMQVATEFRYQFHSDVFIDLVCYRKYGHNETDEPAFTQPKEYAIIRGKQPIRELYTEQLVTQGVLERQIAKELEAEFRQHLQEALEGSKSYKVTPPRGEETYGSRWHLINGDGDLLAPVDTAVDVKTLQAVADRFCAVPTGFALHKKIESLAKERLAMVHGGDNEQVIDWGMGEQLAFASLLWEGGAVRLSGQDCGRGTFSHRQAIWKDAKTGESYIPLAHLKKDQGAFHVYNSPLSEFAVLGFEYGYSGAAPKALVIWEAQFGDFSNGAQIVIDQYIATAEQKWNRQSGLTVLLPHGYEGQGPEHSSARLERFLQLAGNDNMQVVNPTTPAQLFHLLRRQMLRPFQKPLIVMTPKGLLRHPECRSSLRDLSEGRFFEVLPDPTPPEKAKRLILCSGRIFYDLLEARREQNAPVAIIRIEQLYPLDKKALTKGLQELSSITDCLWVQEEPSNMGAWEYLSPILREVLPKELPLRVVARPRSASPSTGSYARHHQESAAIIHAALGEIS